MCRSGGTGTGWAPTSTATTTTPTISLSEMSSAGGSLRSCMASEAGSVLSGRSLSTVIPRVRPHQCFNFQRISGAELKIKTTTGIYRPPPFLTVKFIHVQCGISTVLLNYFLLLLDPCLGRTTCCLLSCRTWPGTR